jgi:hypothetical protein
MATSTSLTRAPARKAPVKLNAAATVTAAAVLAKALATNPIIKTTAQTAKKTAAKTNAKSAVKTATKPTAKTTAPTTANVPDSGPEVVKGKAKLVRDSFTMPKLEYLAIDALKRRAAALAKPSKKSELLRAGVKALSAMTDKAFLAALQSVPTIKTGRPLKP